MAHIVPFHGLRFCTDAKCCGLDLLVAPPYDVISPDQRASLVDGCRNNVVSVDLPAGDDSGKYANAGRTWSQWLTDGTLVPDVEAALYLVHEEFVTPTGQRGSRTGFICELELEDFGVGKIRPHERTYAGPKADRLELMRATNANISQVFALYRDPERELDEVWKRVMESAPDETVTAPDGERSMWVVTNAEMIELARKTLAVSSLTIADGHHRYETALTFRDECRAKGILPASDGLMVYLSNMDDPGLVILPTHRAVKLPEGSDPTAIRGRLEGIMTLKPVTVDHPEIWLASAIGEETDEPYRFGIFSRECGWMLATLNSWDSIAHWIDPTRSEAWRRLDVAVLHEAILREIFGLTQETVERTRPISYVVNPVQGHDKVVAGDADVLLQMRPTAASQIGAVADTGDTMPQKSTYFYPKLLTGLVMRGMDTGESGTYKGETTHAE
jgi:uncharacterized protein (DUF1015 family)